jgi:hypothetical protein
MLLLFLTDDEGSASVQAMSNVFYVSPNGDDNNPGSLSQPWQHIDFAVNNSAVRPGDTIFIRDGVYEEYIKQGISGAPGQPIYIRNYPGETPVITGSGSWRWHILGQSHIRLIGLTFSNYQKGGLQIRTRDASITDIEIINCTFEGQGQLNNDGAKTIHVTTADTGNEINHIAIRNNLFMDIDSGDHPAIQIAGNVHDSEIVDNILVTTSSIAIGIAGRPDIGQPERILIEGNDISGHGSPGKHSAGIYLDGAGSHIIVEQNNIHDGQQGIKVSLETAASDLETQYIIVRHNVLYNNSQINLKMGVGDVNDDCGANGKLERSVAVHNTIFADTNGPVNHYFSCGTQLRWKNNIMAHISPGEDFFFKLANNTVDPSTWAVDYNHYHNGGGDKYYHWQGVPFGTLSEYQGFSGQDLNSFNAPPGFVDISQRNFHLQSDSSARDAGGPLTFTTSSGTGNVILVAEAWYFSDGLGMQSGDLIIIGDSTLARIVAVNYATNTITVDRTVSWEEQAPVTYNFSDNGPDIGAHEYQEYRPPTHMFIPSLCLALEHSSITAKLQSIH